MARPMLVVLCALVASTRSWAPSATYGAGRVVRLRSSAEFVGDARDALRGASSKLEAPLRALELELQEAKRETDAAERALASALAALAASEADARRARATRRREAAKKAEVAPRGRARRSNERRVAAARTLAETAEGDAKREIRATVVALESQIADAAAARGGAASDAAAAARAATAADVAAAEADGAARLEAAQLRLRAVSDEDAAEDEPLVGAVAASALAGFLLFSNQLQGGLSPFSLFGALLGAFLFAAFGLKAPEKT
ncbi:hypothetical protein JL720_4133 [Aureococcus anophagefferens]|nr:hypothetical protein JL720_4133 [Aureococcus anophagefferens]